MNIAVIREPHRFFTTKPGLIFLVVAFLMVILMLGVAFMGPNAELTRRFIPAAPQAQMAAFQTAPASPLLVWVANGAAPGKQTAGEPGQLAYVNSSGVAETVLELPKGTSRVESCGDTPT